MIRCLIVEDEPLAQKVIERYIAQTTGLELSAVCNNAVEAFEVLHAQQVDVIFLDIKMPGIDGMAFLRSLKQPPPVIFITAYTEYAAQSYEVEAVDYLMKPVTYERFLKSIDKLLKKNNVAPQYDKPPYIYIKESGKLIKIQFADILHIEAMKDYLKLVTPQKTHVTHMTMKAIQQLLPQDLFIRIHRSHIVAAAHIISAGGSKLTIAGKTIPLGESYRKSVLKYLNKNYNASYK